MSPTTTPTTNENAAGLNKEAQTIKTAIDENATDSPALSIDPKTSKMSIVGDPNQTAPTSGNYDLTFRYPADSLSDDDKKKMTYDEMYDEYTATVKYQKMRVKPLYRTKITLLIARILDDMGVIDKDGYNSDLVTNLAGQVLVDHIEDLSEIARMVLNVPKEQLEYMDPAGLANFFSQLLANEKNIVQEAIVFLMSSSNRLKADQQTTEKTDTPQS